MTTLAPGWGFYGRSKVSPAKISFIRAGFARGMTISAIQGALSGTPLATRRQAIVDIGREARSVTEFGVRRSTLRRDFRPDESLIPQINQRLRTTYRYTAKVNLVLADGTALRPMEVMFGDDRNLTQEQIDRRAIELVDRALVVYGARVTSVTPGMQVRGRDS